jgi:hypothetical protein
MSKSTKAEQSDEIQGPAIVTPLHVLDRPATDPDGKPITGSTAWRKLTPLQAVYAKNMLAGGSQRFTAADRYGAGSNYTAIWDAAQGSGRDSTQALNAVRGGSGGSPSDARAKAVSQLARVNLHLGARDRKIVSMVCGEGYWPSEAVRDTCGDYRDTVSARFREALDALCEAFETSRRRG